MTSALYDANDKDKDKDDNNNKDIKIENKDIDIDSTNRKIHYLSNIQKIYCISDLHVDSDENMNWIQNQCHDFTVAFGDNDSNNESTNNSNSTNSNSNSIIIVAGDISHQLQKIETTLKLLIDTGAYIVFVPGNHEAWLTKSELDNNMNLNLNGSDSNSTSTATASVQQSFNSITKLKQIQNLCYKLGVYTTGNCICVNGGMNGGIENENDNENDDSHKNNNDEVVWILPLDGWYDGSLSFHEHGQHEHEHEQHRHGQHYNLVSDFLKWPWVDFQRCIWPLSLWEEFDELELDDDQQNQNQSRSRLLKKIPYGLVDYFLQQNQKNILDVYHHEQHKRHQQQQQEQSRSSNTISTKSTNTSTKTTTTTLITVTHFLTNQQSLPDWCNIQESKFNIKEWLEHGVPGISAKFALVAGSSKIDQQIRSIQILNNNGHNENGNELLSDNNCKNKRIHIFGHSHRPKDFIYDGIRYIHNPLGKPRERKTIIRYWEQYGGGLKMLQKRMKDQRQLREKQRQQRRTNNT
ncbi:hypothetical protein FRACYDRAFT_254149 [Fragilariopsis cylindrus CCMP1102]|uniref:Uncharacterized protein n=1 Tax=Fragilariopsis cylindrus CCMP1102 TaxID=635003 RepID=A0A1E7EL09_9STRA|nr:hypothetical protein FRACYDRAFT_254149 [Fragilariopsis cylindrus CCMP1102]|eukprot:OEU06601.1 hypothetical protein FRACYDRAFT_254149 [Fragilariopsis cylindrus CCMP1102]